MKPKRPADKKKSRTAKAPRRAPAPPAARREFSAGFVLFRRLPAADPAEPLFLLLDYGKHWDYPKGHLEKDETAWQAAVRELQEETGIREVRRVGDFEKQIRYFFRSPKKGAISKTVTFFIGETPEKNVTLSHEHSAFEWLPYSGARERLTYPTAREILDAAWQYLQTHSE